MNIDGAQLKKKPEEQERIKELKAEEHLIAETLEEQQKVLELSFYLLLNRSILGAFIWFVFFYRWTLPKQ